MNDHEIIELYWARDERAITESDSKYGNYCRTISYNILHNSQDAEECVNDTWIGAWNAMPPKRPGRLSAFLGKITRNLSLNRLKRATTQKRGGGQIQLALSELEECLSDDTTPETDMEDERIVQAINAFLYAQPEEKRHIFVRRYWYMHSIRDIAKWYGMSESKVTSLLWRMRGDLKAYLEQEGIYV